MEEFLNHVSGAPTQLKAFNYALVFELVGNSLLLGVFLALLTYFTSSFALRKIKGSKREKLKGQLILGSANILFLCVGMTGVMILVNNNLARAFAIGAALALVRFRVTLGEKSVGSNLLFGIIAGIACGLNELPVAYVMSLCYFLLQTSLLVILIFMAPDDKKVESLLLGFDPDEITEGSKLEKPTLAKATIVKDVDNLFTRKEQKSERRAANLH